MSRPATRPEPVREILARAPRCAVCEIPSPDVPLVAIETKVHKTLHVCPSCATMLRERHYAA